jgi:hypothetical protein
MKFPPTLLKIRDRQWERLTPAQANAIENNWRQISARGPAMYVLQWGSILFVWTVICTYVFAHLFHTQRVMHQPFYLLTAAPTILLLSIAAPAAIYINARARMRRLKLHQAQHASENPLHLD